MYSGKSTLILNSMSISLLKGLLDTGFDINILVVWIMLTINSLVGCYTWFRRSRKSRNSPVKI